MAKRKRNSLGQFIPSAYMAQKERFLQMDFLQRIIAIFMVLLFLFMASPWLTLALKSKTLKMWIHSISKFYGEHFIGEDEINGRYKCPKPQEDI